MERPAVEKIKLCRQEATSVPALLGLCCRAMWNECPSQPWKILRGEEREGVSVEHWARGAVHAIWTAKTSWTLVATQRAGTQEAKMATARRRGRCVVVWQEKQDRGVRAGFCLGQRGSSWAGSGVSSPERRGMSCKQQALAAPVRVPVCRCLLRGCCTEHRVQPLVVNSST